MGANHQRHDLLPAGFRFQCGAGEKFRLLSHGEGYKELLYRLILSQPSISAMFAPQTATVSTTITEDIIV